MIRQDRMRNYPHVAFGHVASGAVVWRRLALADSERQRAAFFRVAGQAFRPVIRGSVLCSRFLVRVVASDATEMSATAAVAFAERHRKVVFQEIRLRRIASRRDHENRQGVIERSSGLEVAIVLTGLQNNRVTRLM